MRMTNITTKSKSNWFFKVIASISFVVMVFFCGLFLTGCGDTENTEPTQQQSQQKNTESEKKEGPLDGGH